MLLPAPHDAPGHLSYANGEGVPQNYAEADEVVPQEPPSRGTPALEKRTWRSSRTGCGGSRAYPMNYGSKERSKWYRKFFVRNARGTAGLLKTTVWDQATLTKLSLRKATLPQLLSRPLARASALPAPTAAKMLLGKFLMLSNNIPGDVGTLTGEGSTHHELRRSREVEIRQAPTRAGRHCLCSKLTWGSPTTGARAYPRIRRYAHACIDILQLRNVK